MSLNYLRLINHIETNKLDHVTCKNELLENEIEMLRFYLKVDRIRTYSICTGYKMYTWAKDLSGVYSKRNIIFENY